MSLIDKLKNYRSPQITLPETDMLLMLVTGVIVFIMGLSMLERPKLGGTFMFLGVVNLLNSWRCWRQLQNRDNSQDGNQQHN